MANIGVCIEPFFCDLPYGGRIKRIKELGFKSYEFWFLDKRFDGKNLVDEGKNLDEIAETNEKLGLRLTDFVFNHPDGGLVRSLIDPGDRSALADALPEFAEKARKLSCDKLISGTGNRIPAIPGERAVDNIIETLRVLAPICEREKITLILEPFNTKVDHPDYFLDDPFLSVKILKAVGSRNIKLLYDIYHMQIMSGNILAFIRSNLEHMGHFHIAGVPGRHEPCECELNYRYIVKEIERMGYRGGFGLEYWPTVDHARSLELTLECLR